MIGKIHTYSSGMTMTHGQFKEVWNACCKTGCIQDDSKRWEKKEELYCYAYLDQGIKVYLHSKPGKLYRLRVQIEPCRVLGETDPTALARMNRAQYQKMVKTADTLLKKLKVPCSIDKMKISRCDLTINLEFSDQNELMEYLRIFKKGLLIYPYEHIFFKKHDQKVKDWKAANDHSHCISCNGANFLIYDKIAQLVMIDRYDESLVGKHILRFEAELKRTSIKKHLGKSAMETNSKLLSAAAQKSPEVIRWYLNRMQPPCEKYLRYKDAVGLIEDAKLKEKTRDRMLYLLRKTSDKETLTAALKALKVEYHLTGSQCRTVLKKFRKLGISPITLPNSSELDELPPICF